MAIPTITSASPNTLYTGGQIVTINGTNFRGPYAVPSTGVVPTPPPTVSVLFDGVAADKVVWISATKITCLAPNHDPGVCSVTIKNLDSSGVPIAGETVTAASLVSFARADLSIKTDFSRLSENLLLLLRQQIIANVVMTTETDYTSDASAATFNFVAVAELPCVVVHAPTTKLNSFYDLDLIPEKATDTGYEQRRFMRTVDVSWKILVLDDHQGRTQNLLALVQQFFTINNWLYLDRDPSNLSLGKVQYEMQCGEFGSIGDPNNNNVRGFSGDVTVRGFGFEDVAGFPGTMISRQGGTADSITYSLGNEGRVI